MLTAATLVGATLGAAVFNALALWITKAWPMSTSKILIVGVVMFLLLSLGDNAVRENEPLATTFLRVGIAQIIVTFVSLVIEMSRSPRPPDQKA